MNNKNKFPSFFSKVSHMRELFNQEHDENWDVKVVAVEENAKRFSSGFSSADTILTLAKFNGILCYLLYDKYNKDITNINVRTARKILGLKVNYKDKSKTTKQKVLDFAMEKHPEYPWVYRTVKGEERLVKINEDRADSYIIAAAAFNLEQTS